MALRTRVIINGSRVSISRQGVDASTAPRTSDYMAVDSSIAVERLLASGMVFNTSIQSGWKVSLSGVLELGDPPPIVLVESLTRGNPSTIYKTPILDVDGTDTKFIPFNVNTGTHSSEAYPFIQVSNPWQGSPVTPPYITNGRDWIWMAFRGPTIS